jgi:alpha-beta hydrolase superfamily lysophospholipase
VPSQLPAPTVETFPLRDGSVATLLRFRAADPHRGAVLQVHGFSDYFFHDHVAEHLTAQGYDLYALDLRRYGRSLRPGDVPGFVDDLSDHFEELDLAARSIAAHGHRGVAVLAHSTGGLIAPLWLDARRTDPLVTGLVRALVLNSPWFELAEPWPVRTVGMAVVTLLAKLRPQLVIHEGGGGYTQSLHRDHRGEWEFDLARKPLRGFPVRAGWLAAVRRGHRRLHRGLRVPVPVLVLRSSASALRLRGWDERAMRADAVLDVEHMTRFAHRVGPDVTVVEIPDGMHDLFLSAAPARGRAFAALDAWLGERLTPGG